MQEILKENRDSIKISKTSRGYSWDIKLYYDNSSTDPSVIIEKLKAIDLILKKEFDT